MKTDKITDGDGKINFPDKPPPGHTKLPATIENVDCLMKANNICVRYNVICKKDEVTIPGHQGTSDNLDNVTLTTIVSLAAKHGLPTGHIAEYVQAIADRNAFNPVADWIRSLPWDGVDRLGDICATIVVQDDYPIDLKNTLLRKWLLSAVAAAVLPSGFKCRGVLTLQGPQGIGKTSWVKQLVSDAGLKNSAVKLDHHLDVSNKDTILGAIVHWLVEIGELESSFRKDIARLKGFLTADFDKVRRPYGRRESEYPRRTVFLATVNDARFLPDDTGNSRWWTIAAKSLDYGHHIDMQQVFAQLAVSLAHGETWWLTSDEEQMLEVWNSRHRTVSAIAEKLAESLDLVGPRNIMRLTATEVLERLGYSKPTNAQAKECAAALRELVGESKRINGVNRWPVAFKAAELGYPSPRGISDPDDETY